MKHILKSTLINEIAIIFIIMFISLCNSNSFAQDTDLTIKTEIVDKSGPDSKDAKIIVTVTSSNPGYTYYLYEGDIRYVKTHLQKSDYITDEEYTFSGLKSGDYTVCVYDADENSKCQAVTIK